MRSMTLPGIERPMSTAVLGTMTFGDTVDQPAAAEMVTDFLQAGGTGIDTANGYAGGASERMLGAVLAEHRDDVVLATKVGIPHPDAEGAAPLSDAAVRRCVEGSLRRLRTGRVELLYLHQPDRATPAAETVRAVHDLMARGLVGAWGVSNYAAWQIGDLQRIADDLGGARPVIAQQVYNALATRLDVEYAEFAATSGIPTVVYNPLGGGLLTGRYRLDAPAEAGRFGSSRLAGMYRERYWNAAMFEAVGELAEIADDAGLPLAEVALRWVLGRPVADAVLIGGSRPENIRTNVRAIADGALDPAIQDRVQAVSDRVAGPMPQYNR